MELCTDDLDEAYIRTVRVYLYYQKMVQIEKYDHVTPFPDVALNPSDLLAQVFFPKKEMFYVRNMVWKAALVKQKFPSGMFNG